jgi:hypothetical protein
MVMRILAALGLLGMLVAPLKAADTTGAPVGKEAIGPGKCLIRGTATTPDAVPVPEKAVRLRNLDTSLIEQVSATSRTGEFSFVASAEVPYVVEIADEPGRVIAVGPVVLARSGEVAGSPLVIPAAMPAYAGSFRSTAGAVMSAIGGAGLTVLPPATPPLSPEQ